MTNIYCVTVYERNLIFILSDAAKISLFIAFSFQSGHSHIYLPLPAHLTCSTKHQERRAKEGTLQVLVARVHLG